MSNEQGSPVYFNDPAVEKEREDWRQRAYRLHDAWTKASLLLKERENRIAELEQALQKQAAELKELRIDMEIVSTDAEAAQEAFDLILGEGEPDTTSMETLGERAPRVTERYRGLTGALERYGQHLDACASQRPGAGDCDCGWAETKAGLGPPPPVDPEFLGLICKTCGMMVSVATSWAENAACPGCTVPLKESLP